MPGTGIYCSGANVIRKAGEGISASGAEEIFLNDVIGQAESAINAATRKNWTDNYAALNADVKQILKEAASNLAAIYAISYDMSGYSSRAEAETMLNVLKTRFDECVELLKEINVQTFIMRE